MLRDDEVPDPRPVRAGSPIRSSAVAVIGLALVLAVGAGTAAYLRPRAKTAESRAEAHPLPSARLMSNAANDDQRAGVREPVTIDGLTVKLLSVEVGRARVYRTERRDAYVDDDQVSLLVRVELSAAGRTYEYRTWRSPASPPAADDLGYKYPARPVIAGTAPDWLRERSLSDGDTAVDTLAFRPPVGSAGRVDLDLPGRNAGVEGTFRFRVPRAAWEKK
jgi:hypothetical protein